MAGDQEKLARLYRALPRGGRRAAAQLAAAAALLPAELEAALEGLRAAGAAVEGDAAQGFGLSLPPPLEREALTALVTTGVGRNFFLRETVATTMAAAEAAAAVGAPHGTAVLAEGQTAGRGRRGRSWASPSRLGLYLSVVLERRRAPPEITVLPLLAGVAVAEAIAAETAVAVGVKWPNDLLAGGAKVGGILAEAHRDPGVVIVGIGVNCWHCLFDFPPDLPYLATSLAMAGAASLDRTALAAAILNDLGRWLERWAEEGVETVLAAWRERNVTLGRRVRVADTGVVGLAAEVADDGALVVVEDDGREYRIQAGDVIPLD
ncbi:MAG: biotin--[acetyl-CoA-carboxylase] ligase [Candidatus Coatesbacteria bacterium]|nr:MAG: biotin--[acetyl-CoA-carboxylase] ligase [Candidatus Coatesbacteria bacterium]